MTLAELSTRIRALFVTVGVFLIAGVGLSQTTHESEQPEAHAVIRSSVREVLLDLIVRDKKGKLVTNLAPGDVEVYEDGVRRNVLSFHPVKGSEVRSADEKANTESTNQPNSKPPEPNPLRATNLVCLVFQDLTPETRTFAFKAAKQFVDRELRPNTFIGVFTLTPGGLRRVIPFTNDREQLIKGMGQAATDQLPGLAIGSVSSLNGIGQSSNAGDDPTDPLGTRGDIGFNTITGLREIDDLVKLVGQLSPLSFQKTVLLLSPGFIRPADNMDYWESLITAARKGGITFYGLDPLGLHVDFDGGGDPALKPALAMLNQTAALSKLQRDSAPQLNKNSSKASGATGQPLLTGLAFDMARTDDFVTYTVLSANRQAALRELAEETGGFLIANTDNVGPPLTRIMDDVDTHYEIAYQPGKGVDDGHFRQIKVKLTNASLRVQAREGYFAMPDSNSGPLTAAEVAGLQSLNSKPLPHSFEFRSQAFRFHASDNADQYVVAFDVPISALHSAIFPKDKRRRFHVSLFAVAKNLAGQVIDWFGKDVDSTVSDDELKQLLTNHMTYEHSFHLPAGRYTIETAVVDEEARAASTNAFGIDDSEIKGQGLSQLVLARRVENLTREPIASDAFEFAGKRVIPELATVLPVGENPYVYFIVYPARDNASEPKVTMEFIKDRSVLAKVKPRLPLPDASGQIPMLVHTIIAPGSYELRITEVQGRDSVERSLKYTIASK